MTLYSHNGAEPAPLPHRIRIPDGAGGWRTRTDPGTFTADEIATAGYVAAEPRPAPVGGVEAQWDGTAWQPAPAIDPARELPPRWNGTAWSEPAARPVADRQAEMDRRLKARFDALVAQGADVGGTIVDLAGESFVRIFEAGEAMGGGGSIAAVTVRRQPIDLANQGQANAVRAAARARYQALAAHERTMFDAIFDPAADHDSLDAIDVDAGSIDGSGGWPAGA